MIELLKDLIRAESTLAVGEVAAAEVLRDYFVANGIDCEVDVWDGNRANASVRIKSDGTKGALLFAAHIDVVPPGDAPWKYPPFDGVEAEGRINGRGASDMKAGTAATAAAIVDIVKSGEDLKGDIFFAATAGEETDSCGIKRFMAGNADTVGPLAGIVIPEPTNFDIVTAHRGMLWLEVTTKGKTAHGSMPQEGINAIMQMNHLLTELQGYEIPCEAHPLFGKCSMSVNEIAGGKAPNVIPDSCTIKLDIRTVPGQSHQTIIEDIEKLCSDIKAEHAQFDAEVKIVRSVEGIATDTDCEFVKTLCDATGICETQTVGYTTDAPHLLSLNAPIVIFGPGKSEVCHKPDEYVDIADVEKGRDIFGKVIF